MRITLVVFSFVLGASVYGDEVNLNNKSMQNTNSNLEKQENAQMFEQRKSIIMHMHQQRMQIIQNGYNCISSATNREALRTCEMTEKQSIEQLFAQARQQRKSIKQEPENMGQIDGNRSYIQPKI